MKLLIILIFVSSSCCSTLPDWVELDCSPGHQYFFSDKVLSWFDAIDECNLYGGYLVAVNSLQEQNCLLKYGKTAQLDRWFWINGNLKDSPIFSRNIYFIANDYDTYGIFLHDDGNEVPFINHRWSCGETDGIFRRHGYHYIMPGIFDSLWYASGCWCDKSDQKFTDVIFRGLDDTNDPTHDFND